LCTGLADGMANLQKAGNISDAISGAMVLADVRIAQGRLHDPARTYGQSLQLATEQASRYCAERRTCRWD
jgi:LuxR family maltose regulon positive regulatory protein